MTVLVGYKIHLAGSGLIPIGVAPLVAGVLFAGRRMAANWLDFLITSSMSFLLSFVAFLPNKRPSHYNVEPRVEAWPYTFMGIFILSLILTRPEKTQSRLSWQYILLQSTAVIYWVLDQGFFSTESLFLKLLMLIGLTFAFYSFFLTFTVSTLSKSTRLTLSTTSCVILILLAIDNIVKVYSNGDIANAANLAEASSTGIQYFLLGVSSIYIIENFMMLFGFLPGKGRLLNAPYFLEMKDLKNDHINRSPTSTVPVAHSAICIFVTGLAFFLNHHYHILPTDTAIWALFVTFPTLINLYRKAFLAEWRG